MDHPDSTEEIPTLDIGPFFGDKGVLETVAHRLGEITETIGFFYLKDHGVPQELVDRIFSETRRFMRCRPK